MSSSATRPAPEETEPERPVVVTVAAGLMVAVVVTYLAISAVTLTALNKIINTVGNDYQQFAGDPGAGVATFQVSMVVTVVVDVAVGTTLVLLAIGNLRRRRGARTGTRVIAGLFLMCALCGSISNGSVAAGKISLDSDNALLREQLLPSWYTPTTIVLDVVLAVLYAGVIVLLALPVSNRYFDFVKLPSPVFP